MVPAAYPSYYIINLESGGDYYYACTGGDSDDLLDLMYGRLPVGNETELSNNVNKIINYEHNYNGSWCNDYTFVAGSPDVFYIADPRINGSIEIVPPTYSKSYAYRAYDTSLPTVVTEANPKLEMRFTQAQYTNNPQCGSSEINNWLFDDPVAGINNRIHTFIYEGHGGPRGLDGGIFKVEDLYRLHNDLYSFMIFNACETGHFDNGSADAGDCLAEAVVNLGSNGAIGVLASTRVSDTGGFGQVDAKVLVAMYFSLSHIMGEAIMESKLNNMSRYKRRQYNLYGDPAVNLWPTGYTVTENLTLSGTVQISNNITVASGVTLTIQSGTTLRFSPGASLIVNGGTIQYCNITNASSGISLNNTLSPVLAYNTISNCSTYGMYMTNASPRVYYNTIGNNGNTGIKCDNYSSPILYNNTITGHPGYGLNCYYYSSAWLSNKPSSGCCPGRGYNVIRQNGTGISAAYGSNVFLGDREYGGYNCVHDNIGYELSAAYNSGFTIMAENTWWNHTTSPYYSASDFYSYSSTIDYVPAFPGPDPNNCPTTPLPKASTAGNSTIAVQQTSSADEEFLQLFRLELEGKYEEAMNWYLEKYKKEKIIEKRQYALVRLAECFKAAKKEGFIDLLNKDIRQKLSKQDTVYATTLELENNILMNAGSFEQVKENLNTLRSNFTGNKQIHPYALFQMGFLYRNQLKDNTKAKECFDELKAKYPDDEVTNNARLLLGEINKIDGAPDNTLKKEKKTEEAKAPDQFALLVNFPNPFNPSTIINYQISTPSTVSLKVYDMLGREVASLADGVKEAGYYTTIFNGSKLASGVYFVRFTAQPADGSALFTKTMKILMTK
jgi:tetratricopeptide (TPR) repeat protein